MPETSKTGRPPFRADHVGSLLRPPELLRARDDFAAGRISADELRDVEDTRDPRGRAQAGGGWPARGDRRRAAPRVVAHGLHLPARRRQEGAGRHDQGGVPQRAEELRVGAAVGACRRAATLEHTIFGDAFSFLADTVTTAVPKLTIPSLSMVHYRGGRSAIDESVYPDLDQFWADLAATYAQEVRRAVRARLPLPAVRRHQPGLHERPGPAPARGRHRRGPRAPA